MKHNFIQLVFVFACISAPFAHLHKHAVYIQWESCLYCTCVAHLLCDGKANDGVSLWDVPCHHSRLCLHLFDGHIDRRRQAICKHTERQREKQRLILSSGMKQMRSSAPLCSCWVQKPPPFWQESKLSGMNKLLS